MVKPNRFSGTKVMVLYLELSDSKNCNLINVIPPSSLHHSDNGLFNPLNYLGWWGHLFRIFSERQKHWLLPQKRIVGILFCFNHRWKITIFRKKGGSILTTVHPIMIVSMNRTHYFSILNTFLEQYRGLSTLILIPSVQNYAFMQLVEISTKWKLR